MRSNTASSPQEKRERSRECSAESVERRRPKRSLQPFTNFGNTKNRKFNGAMSVRNCGLSFGKKKTTPRNTFQTLSLQFLLSKENLSSLSRMNNQEVINEAYRLLNRVVRQIRNQIETKEVVSKETMESLELLLSFLDDYRVEGGPKDCPLF